jgi:hypothetical protein
MNDWLIDWKTSIDDVEEQGFLLTDIDIYSYAPRIDQIKMRIFQQMVRENMRQF